jgi:hypothetical protein
MASPFSIFRKNQRLWMAGAVLIAILAFVVAPMLESFSGYNQGVRPGAETVAASWYGGSISQDQIDSELVQLGIANTFLRKLASDVQAKGGFPQVPDVAPNLSFVGIAPPSNDPNTIIQRKLLVKEANRLGIFFDDQSVKTFLTRFVDGKLDGDQIKKSLREVSGGRMTLLDFNRLMKEELAKNAMIRLSNSTQRFEERIDSRGSPTALLNPPSKNWQYFLRFNRAASIEAYPIYAKDFKDAVTAIPSDRELRALFDEGKSVSRIEVDVQTQPAFMTPPMADFEFLAIDRDRIMEQEKAKIPEDTLRAEYDRRVKENQFQVPDTTPPPETPSSEPPASDAIDTNRPPTLENPSQDPPPPSQSSSPPRRRDPQVSRLVSVQDPAAAALEPPDTEPPDTEPPATEPPATEPAAAEPPTTETPLPKVRTQTFEEVKDSIARELAMGETFKQINQRTTDIRDRMEIYAVNRRAYEQAVREKDKNAVPPEAMNLQQIADENGFQYGRTGLVDAKTAVTLPIGQSRITRGMQMEPIPFFRLTMFPPNPNDSDSISNLYTPLTSSSMTSMFLFWKVEHQEASTPTFESSKEEVKKLWANQRATELAESKARELVGRVGTSSIAESLDDENQRALVVRPAPFTWYNAMFANFGPPQENTVEGLQPINSVFMEKVFSAEPGETIVVPDAAREVFYVVKVESFAPDQEGLLERFAAAPNTMGVRNLADQESGIAPRAWFLNLQKQLGLRQQ